MKLTSRILSFILMLNIIFNMTYIQGIAAEQPKYTIISCDEVTNNSGIKQKIITKTYNNTYYFEYFENNKLVSTVRLDKGSKIVESINSKGNKTVYDITKEVNILDEKILNNTTKLIPNGPVLDDEYNPQYDASTGLWYNYYDTTNYSDLYIAHTSQTQRVNVYLNKVQGDRRYTVNAKGKTCLEIAALLIGAISLPVSSQYEVAKYLAAVIFGGIVTGISDTIEDQLFPTLCSHFTDYKWFAIGMTTGFKVYNSGSKDIISEFNSPKQGKIFTEGLLEENFDKGSNVKLWLHGTY